MTDDAGRAYWTRGLDTGSGRKRPSHYFALIVGSAYVLVVAFLCRVFARFVDGAEADAGDGLSILAVGPFFSENWTAAHLDALCRSDAVAKVAVVTPEAFESKPKREFVVFPESIERRFGAGIARAVAAFRYARHERPNLIIGYHLPWNGAIALLAARMTGCKVFYHAVGGPAELIGGGRYSEHALFSRLDGDSDFIEKRLLHLAGQFDAILTMGSKSACWFRTESGSDAVHPIAVGIDTSIFSQSRRSSAADRRYDVITVGRHSRIKRLDVLLDAVALLTEQGVRIRLALVGDGELRPALETQVAELGIGDSVYFAGWVDDVHAYLHDARIFAMTSASEGLPHSLIESMMAGLPAVVSNVGEMSDLVENGQTGFLAPPGDPVTFANRIRELLASPELLTKCGERATARAARYSVNGRTNIWNELLADL